jgi:hypothetical protein
METEQLSPAAQAVLHSFWDAPVSPARNCQIAAALRAAVKTCVFEDFNNFNTRLLTEADLLAIANELEAQP